MPRLEGDDARPNSVPRNRARGGRSDVSGNVLEIIATILEKTALGGNDSEVAELIEKVREASYSGSAERDIERLRFHLNAVAQVINEGRVNERALNLLNDTMHDLSSTLALQDLLRTIVSRARSLVGANLAWLTQLDEQQGVLRTVQAEGNIFPATWDMKANVGYAAVSLIASFRRFLRHTGLCSPTNGSCPGRPRPGLQD